jgi:sugar/nucleoside kinase (ribokinase family)
MFSDIIIKGNNFELADGATDIGEIKNNCAALCGKSRKPLAVTLGELGCVVGDPDGVFYIPAVRHTDPIDIVGAGDAFTTGFTSALCAGAAVREAGILGNLTASVCIRQLGTTGQASAEQILGEFEANKALFA